MTKMYNNNNDWIEEKIIKNNKDKENIIKFYSNLFKGIDFEQEEIRISLNYGKNDDIRCHSFEEVAQTIIRFRESYNLTFNIATLKKGSENSTEQDLAYKYCMVFDFDVDKDDRFKPIIEDMKSKGVDDKTINKKILGELLKLVKGKGIDYIISSGHGYHMYKLINKTDKIKETTNINKIFGKILGSDDKACLTTQIMRCPYSYNMKDKNNYRKVNVVIEPKKNFTRRDIEYYIIDKDETKDEYDRYDEMVSEITEIEVSQDYIDSRKYICLEEQLKNGTPVGNRHFTLIDLVFKFKEEGYTLNEIKDFIEDWAYKSGNFEIKDGEVEKLYNEWRFDKPKYQPCLGCSNYPNCKINKNPKRKKRVFNKPFNIPKTETNENVFIEQETLREGIDLDMEGLEFLILSVMLSDKKDKEDREINGLVLANQICEPHKEEGIYGMYRKEINKALTPVDKDEPFKGDNAIRGALENLVNRGFIKKKNINKKLKLGDFYYLTPKATTNKSTLEISYFAVLRCIEKKIQPIDLKLYYLMRHIQHKRMTEEKETLKFRGCYLQITLEDLAKEFYKVDNYVNYKSNINNMVKRLEKGGYLRIFQKKKEKKSKDTYSKDYYNVYQLIC